MNKGSIMEVSTFEILLKPLAPGPNPPARTVIQAYFLTITNLGEDAVDLDVNFTSTTPGINPNDNNVITFFDITGTNNVSSLSNVPGHDSRTRRTVNIPSKDTGLFLLQPNVFDPAVLASASLEFRGYVEIFVNDFSPLNDPQTLIVTPEHRGTFLPANLDDPTPPPPEDLDFDQLAYSLPVVGGDPRIQVMKEAA